MGLTIYFLRRYLHPMAADPSRRYALKMIKLLMRRRRVGQPPLAVVALTSHDLRVADLHGTIFSILNGSCQRVKIVLTLYKEDLPLLGGDVKRLVQAGVVELIAADKDLGPHLKYFYAMQRYRDLPVITIDDDVLYPKEMVQGLLERHAEWPEAVIGRRCFELRERDGQLAPYEEMLESLSQLEEPSHRNFATGIGGTLYPPDIFKLSDADIPAMMEMKYDDDVYLKAVEVRRNIKVLSSVHDFGQVYGHKKMDARTQSIGLWVTRNKALSDANMRYYGKEFLAAARGSAL